MYSPHATSHYIFWLFTDIGASKAKLQVMRFDSILDLTSLRRNRIHSLPHLWVNLDIEGSVPRGKRSRESGLSAGPLGLRGSAIRIIVRPDHPIDRVSIPPPSLPSSSTGPLTRLA